MPVCKCLIIFCSFSIQQASTALRINTCCCLLHTKLPKMPTNALRQSQSSLHSCIIALYTRESSFSHRVYLILFIHMHAYQDIVHGSGILALAYTCVVILVEMRTFAGKKTLTKAKYSCAVSMYVCERCVKRVLSLLVYMCGVFSVFVAEAIFA